MINIAIDTASGAAKPQQYALIKAGALVPVTITFSSAPGALPLIELALSGQGNARGVVAYLGAFERQNATLYTGWLDANDARLHALLAGKAATVDCEVIWIVDGRRQVAPNFPIVVQPPVVTGPEQSEGGPYYYTSEQTEALLGEVLATATITIGTVTTTEPGEDATVVNSGTPAKAILDFSLPRALVEPDSIAVSSASGATPIALTRFAVVDLTLADDTTLEQSGPIAPGSICNINIFNPDASTLSFDASINIDWCDSDVLPPVPPDGCIVSLVWRGTGQWKGAWRA